MPEQNRSFTDRLYIGGSSQESGDSSQETEWKTEIGETEKQEDREYLTGLARRKRGLTG